MTLTKIGASLGGGADTISVTQAGHGLTLGYPVKANGNGTYAHATADSAANAEAIGIIIETTTNTMLIALSGRITVDGCVPNLSAGTVLFLQVSAGLLAAAEPSSNNQVSKPMAVITYANSEMILLAHRGEVISTAGVVSAPTDAQYVTLAVDGTLSAERVLTAGSGITLTDAGANGAATISIANDAIDSQHYNAASIDNEHLADNAVDSAELAAGSVDFAHMSVNSINSDQYVDGSIDRVHLAADIVDGTKIDDDVINSEHYVAGSIDLEHMASQSVDEDNLYISNAGSNGEFLSKQSGNNGGLTWAAAGGNLVLIGTAVASGSASLTITGLSSTYDTYLCAISDVNCATDGQDFGIRVGDSGGVDSGAGDYSFHTADPDEGSTSYVGGASGSASRIGICTSGLGNGAAEGLGAVFYIHVPQDSTNNILISGTKVYRDAGGLLTGGGFAGMRKSSITLDRVQIISDSGNIDTGRFTVWGIKHD